MNEQNYPSDPSALTVPFQVHSLRFDRNIPIKVFNIPPDQGVEKPSVRSFFFFQPESVIPIPKKDPVSPAGETGSLAGLRECNSLDPFSNSESAAEKDPSANSGSDPSRSLSGDSGERLENKDGIYGVNGAGDLVDLSEDLTRIRVPSDIIKVEDRLNYILQPPLELLLGRNSLEMPFAPFGYQKQGIAFLYSAHFAILADEMGLGKTMQAITTIRLLLRSGECRQVLLVCPKPLVTNWKREFELWAPEIPVQVIEGKSERRKWLWQLRNVPVRIANYELLHRDREFFDLPQEQKPIRFDLVVLDESQRIKNRTGATSEAACSIPRKRNWALTGTPIENSSDDLVGIFEFLSPGYLTSGLKPSRIRSLVGDHILRRTKDKVLTDLPPKLMRDAHIELQGEQWETYRMAKEEGEIRLNEMGDSLTLHHAFELILRLKQICNFDPVSGESAKVERLTADLEEVSQSGRKAIIFSQWVETLVRLKALLKDFHPVEYHGRIPSKDRDGVLKKFKEDENCHVILMSYGAGSVGLNLQFAGYVFLFDRWWNPAIEDQAINRAHRIGASGPVTVSRFVCVGTIEEKIDRILQEKRELSESILSGAKGLNYSMGLSQEDIFGLFDLKINKNGK
ncbi:MAG: DEAD/DEAH box helicase [Planctomycetia bacterium]|nr:DEAD/DEAH box helicase [Planctomycetia bacterium]